MSRTAPVAVVTGASSGIGAASARALAGAGFDVVLGARRLDLLTEVADGCGGRAARLDVTDSASVAAFAAGIERCDLLVNNAGGALGSDAIADAEDQDWQWMFDVNVLGTLRVTRALLPKLIASGGGPVSAGAGVLTAAAASRCGSARSTPGWCRPTSAWCGSGATGRRRTPSTAG